MPTSAPAPVGAPTWVDLFTSDTDKMENFYGQLFGWTASHAGEEYGGYVTFSKNELPVAGCMKTTDVSRVE